MYPLIPLPALADEVAVQVGSNPYAALTALVSGVLYAFVSSTACWVRQGSAWLITCVAKASLATNDYVTVSINGVDVSYQFDLTGTTQLLPGMIRVDVHTDTTAATVAARLRTAILANQAALAVTDNSDGTLTVVESGVRITMTEHVTDAGFLVAKTTLVASAAAGNMYWPANTLLVMDGRYGDKVSVIRDAADGKSTLTPCRS